MGELASRLKVNVAQVIKKLMGLGIMAAISEVVDFDTASLVAEELGAKVEHEVHVTIEERLFEVDEDKDEDLEERPACRRGHGPRRPRARPPSWTPSAKRALPRARPAA